jgi:alpha-galactosidase
VALLNRTSFTQPISVSWHDLGLRGPVGVRDVWAAADVGSFASGYTTAVASHGVALLVLRDQAAGTAGLSGYQPMPEVVADVPPQQS